MSPKKQNFFAQIYPLYDPLCREKDTKKEILIEDTFPVIYRQQIEGMEKVNLYHFTLLVDAKTEVYIESNSQSGRLCLWRFSQKYARPVPIKNIQGDFRLDTTRKITSIYLPPEQIKQASQGKLETFLSNQNFILKKVNGFKKIE